MCQLLGMNCNTPTDIVFSFTGFATRGGLTDHHSDGWGIAFYEGVGVRYFVDYQAATASPVAEFIKNYPIKSKNVISHIRKATQGEVSLANSHPFVREMWGQYWVFAHNGDLKNFSPQLSGRYQPVGTTDSEQAFCYLLQELRQMFGTTRPTMAALTSALRKITRDIAAYGTFNMLLSDGQALFAHCTTNLYYIVRQHPFTTAKLSDEDLTVDFSRVTTNRDRVAVIVTEPLTANEQWIKFGAGEFKVFMDGEAVSSMN